MALDGCSNAAASREMQFIRDCLSKKTIETPKNGSSTLKKRHQKITITEYCKLYDLDESTVRQKLGI